MSRTTRAERLAQPRAVDAVRMLAEASGGCIRPVQLRKTSLDTSQTEQVIVPCGSPLESVCAACAERCRSLRAAQCREGWHLEDEPADTPAPSDDWQTCLLEKRAELQRLNDLTQAAGDDPGELEELLAELDTELTNSGIRGHADPGRKDAPRRHRSTRRRQDTPALPRREVGAASLVRVHHERQRRTP